MRLSRRQHKPANSPYIKPYERMRHQRLQAANIRVQQEIAH